LSRLPSPSKRLACGLRIPYSFDMENPPRQGVATSHWNATGRWLVFLLAATSLVCLLLDFYRLCPMRLFTPFVFLPAMVALLIVALLDRQRSNGELWRAVMIGIIGGLLAAVAYDLFRLPFVFAKEWGLASVIPPMNLFKVFPGFGAMILGQPIEQSSYALGTQLLGWVYHFSNGATFGVMYVAMIGNPSRRHWAWGVLMATALEAGMLLTPYPGVFNIAVTSHFIVVTMAAHAIFGVGLGLTVRWMAQRVGAARDVAPVFEKAVTLSPGERAG
jgi:hypothetical protein